jgi:hypothetical protein
MEQPEVFANDLEEFTKTITTKKELSATYL